VEKKTQFMITTISKIYKAFVSVYFVSEGQIIADQVTTEINVCLLLSVTVFPERFTLMRLGISDEKFVFDNFPMKFQRAL
jgi:hypothetical protein